MTARDADPLLAAMRRIAAEEEERDAALEGFRDLSAGDLGDEERRALEERTPGGEELAALLRPIDAPRRALVIAAARAALEGEEAPPTQAASAPSGAPAASVLPFAARPAAKAPARSRAVRWAAFGSALAIAAGVALFVVTRPPGIELPAYEASLVGGVRDVRADDAPRVFVPGKPLRVRLRPDQAVPVRVGVVVVLRQGDHATRLDAAVETLEGGALSVQLALPSAPPLQAGPAELLVLVAEPSAIPTDPRAEDLVDAPRHRLVRLPLVIGSP